MGYYYSNATLTLVAGRAAADTEGFIQAPRVSACIVFMLLRGQFGISGYLFICCLLSCHMARVILSQVLPS
jgi:hypothetical protein